ncbi:MAG: hypothetical protein FJ271_05900 [Planctomycetes bacterium]|nr:hypothetical protein [Planctomycetota bacterium]
MWQAVVAQPFNRGARLCAPGKVDPTIDEFWVDNPWDIVGAGFNLSNHERQRFYMNLAGTGFVDLSYLSGADAEGDGRSVVGADFRNNGSIDLIVRKVGGGAVTLYENRLLDAGHKRHYLHVSLRGRTSNRLGIGARLTAYAKGRQIVRELYPLNSYMSQMPNQVHFGLADADSVDRLTIRWPSGQVQELTNIRADRHIVVEEGKEGNAAVETVIPGKTIAP